MAINFDQLPQDNPFALPDPGVYLATIEEAEMRQPKNDMTKPPYLNLKLKITDAEGNSKGIVYDILSESSSSVVQYKIARFVRACNIPLTGSMELKDLSKIVVGKTIGVDITHDIREGYAPKAQVDIFSREAYYLEKEFADINALLQGIENRVIPAESLELNKLPQESTGDAAMLPFDAQDGDASPGPATPTY